MIYIYQNARSQKYLSSQISHIRCPLKKKSNVTKEEIFNDIGQYHISYPSFANYTVPGAAAAFKVF